MPIDNFGRDISSNMTWSDLEGMLKDDLSEIKPTITKMSDDAKKNAETLEDIHKEQERTAEGVDKLADKFDKIIALLTILTGKNVKEEANQAQNNLNKAYAFVNQRRVNRQQTLGFDFIGINRAIENGLRTFADRAIGSLKTPEIAMPASGQIVKPTVLEAVLKAATQVGIIKNFVRTNVERDQPTRRNEDVSAIVEQFVKAKNAAMPPPDSKTQAVLEKTLPLIGEMAVAGLKRGSIYTHDETTHDLLKLGLGDEAKTKANELLNKNSSKDLLEAEKIMAKLNDELTAAKATIAALPLFVPRDGAEAAKSITDTLQLDATTIKFDITGILEALKPVTEMAAAALKPGSIYTHDTRAVELLGDIKKLLESLINSETIDDLEEVLVEASKKAAPAAESQVAPKTQEPPVGAAELQLAQSRSSKPILDTLEKLNATLNIAQDLLHERINSGLSESAATKELITEIGALLDVSIENTLNAAKILGPEFNQGALALANALKEWWNQLKASPNANLGEVVSSFGNVILSRLAEFQALEKTKGVVAPTPTIPEPVPVAPSITPEAVAVEAKVEEKKEGKVQKALRSCLRVCDERTHKLLIGIHKLLANWRKDKRIEPGKDEPSGKETGPREMASGERDIKRVEQELQDRQIYSRPLNELIRFFDTLNKQILGYNPVDKLTQDLVKNAQEFRMQVNEVLYIQQGINQNQREIQRQYELGTITVRDQAERFRDIARLTGQDINVSLKTYVRLMRMGIKDQKVAERLMIHSNHLARQIGANADEVADTFGQWHNQLGFSTFDTAQIARSIREIGVHTGLTGDNLLRAVKSGEGLLKVLRNAGVLSADTARNFLLIRAQADRLGVGDEVDQILRGLASGVDFMDNMNAGMRNFISVAAGHSRRGGGLIQDIILGQGSRQENMRSIAEGIRSMVARQFQGITGRQFDFQMSINDQLQELNDEQRTQMDVFLSRLSGGSVRVGNVNRIFESLMEGTYTLSERLERIRTQLENNVLTPAERANLEMQRMGMILSENFRIQTGFGQAILRMRPGQNLNQILNQQFDSLSPQIRDSLLAMGNNANTGVEAASNSLTDMYNRLRTRFEAAGRLDRFRITEDRVNAALADQTGAAYRRLLEDLNAAQQEIDTAAADAQNPMTEFNAHLRDINAFLQGLTNNALTRFVDSIGVTGIALLALTSAVGIYAARFLDFRKTLAQLFIDLEFLGVQGSSLGGVFGGLVWAITHPFQAMALAARKVSYFLGYMAGVIPGLVKSLSNLGNVPIFARTGEAFAPILAWIKGLRTQTFAHFKTIGGFFASIGLKVGGWVKSFGLIIGEFFAMLGTKFMDLMRLIGSTGTWQTIARFFTYIGTQFGKLIGAVETVFTFLIGQLGRLLKGIGNIGPVFMDLMRLIGSNRFVQGIGEFISGLVGSVSRFFGKIGLGLVETAGALISGIAGKLSGLFGKLNLGGLGSFFSSLAGQFTAGFNTGTLTGAGGLSSILGPIGSGFSKLLKVLGKLAGPLSIVIGLFEAFMHPLKKVIDGIEKEASMLENILFGVFTGGTDTGSFLSSFLGIDSGSLADEALGIVGATLQGAAIGAIFGPWGAAIGALIGLLVELYKIAEFGNSTLRQSLAYFRSWLDDWKTLGIAIADLFTGIFQAIVGYFGGDQNLIDQGLQKIGDSLLEIVSSLWKIIVKLLDMLMISLIWVVEKVPALLFDAIGGLVEAFAPKTAAFIRGFGGLLASIGETLRGLWDVIAGLLTFDWDRVKQGLWTTLVSIATALVRALYTIPEAVWEWVKAIASFLISFPKMVRDWLSSLDLRQVGVNIAKWLQSTFKAAIEWISESLKELLAWFKGIDWGQVLNAIVEFFRDPKNLDVILTVLLALVAVFVAAVVGLPNILIGAVIALGVFIIATLGEAILGGLGQLIMGIGDELGKLWSPLGAFFQGIGAMLRGLGSILGGLVDIFAGLFGLITAIETGNWDEAVGNLLGGLDKVWKGLAAIIVGALGAVIPGLVGMVLELLVDIPLAFVGAIDDVFGTNLLDSVAWVSNWVHGLVDTVKGWFEWLYDFLVGHSIIPDLVRGIIRWFLKLPGAIMQALFDLGAAIYHWVASIDWGAIGQSILAFFAAIPDQIKAWVASIDFRGISRAIVTWARSFPAMIRDTLKGLFSGINIADLIKSIGPMIRNVVKNIIETFRNIDWKGIVDWLKRLPAEIVEWIKGVNWGEVIKGIGIALLVILLAVPAIIAGLASLIIGSIGEAIFGGIAEALNEWADELDGYFGEFIRSIAQVFTGLSTVFSGIADLGEGILTLDWDKILAGVGKISEGLGTIFDGIRQAILNAIGGLGEVVIRAFGGIVENILGVLGIDATGFTEVLVGAWDGFISFMMGMPAMLADGLAQGAAWIGKTVDDIIQWFVDLWKWLVGGSIIPDMVMDIISWFMKLPGRIMSVLMSLGRIVGEAFGRALLSLVELFDVNIIRPIRNFLTGLTLEGVIDMLTTTGGNLAGWFSTNVLDPIRTGWTEFSTWFGTNILDPISTTVRGIGNWLNTNLVQPIAGLGNIVAEALTSIRTFFTNIGRNIWDWIGTNMPDVRAIGENLGSTARTWFGLAQNAVSNAISAAMAWITTLPRRVWGFVTNGMGNAIAWIRDRLEDMLWNVTGVLPGEILAFSGLSISPASMLPAGTPEAITSRLPTITIPRITIPSMRDAVRGGITGGEQRGTEFARGARGLGGGRHEAARQQENANETLRNQLQDARQGLTTTNDTGEFTATLLPMVTMLRNVVTPLENISDAIEELVNSGGTLDTRRQAFLTRQTTIQAQLDEALAAVGRDPNNVAAWNALRAASVNLNALRRAWEQVASRPIQPTRTVDASSGIIVESVPYVESNAPERVPSQALQAMQRSMRPRVLSAADAAATYGTGPITSQQLIRNMNQAAGVTDIFANNANAQQLRVLLPFLTQAIQSGTLTTSLLQQIEGQLSLSDEQTARLFDYLLRSSMHRGLENMPVQAQPNPYLYPGNPYNPYGTTPYSPYNNPYAPRPYGPGMQPQSSLQPIERTLASLEEPLIDGAIYQAELLRHATRQGSLYTHDKGAHDILHVIGANQGSLEDSVVSVTSGAWMAMQAEITRYLANLLELENEEVKRKGTQDSPIFVRSVLPTTKTMDPEDELRLRKAEMVSVEAAANSSEMKEVSENTEETAKSSAEMAKTMITVAKLLDVIRKLMAGGTMKGKKVNGIEVDDLISGFDLDEMLNTDWNMLYQESVQTGIVNS